MPDRQKHKQEILSFLQRHFRVQDWRFSLPPGTGMETYFVRGNEQEYFLKVGIQVDRYQTLADIGLTPPILASGQLDSGPSFILQPRIQGRNPSRMDYREHWETVAEMIHTMHNDPRLRKSLQPAPSSSHKDAGLRALQSLRERWECHKARVGHVAQFVESSLNDLEVQIRGFSTAGLVSSHNDICNANWLFAADGNIYIVDFESMSMDDPAFDLGALLWWYYPPELRGQFLHVAGYSYDEEFKIRMQIRMALHCLSITLPRKASFDSFDPETYEESLIDFKAILDGKENPQGYST